MLASLEWIRNLNRSLNDFFFPRSQVRYVGRFRDLASTLTRDAEVILHLGSGPKDLGATLGKGSENVKVINLDLGLQDLRKNPGTLRVCSDAEALPVAGNEVDAICSEHVFEHFAAPERVLAECFRILKPGGHLVVSGPNGRSYIALAARLTPLKFHDRIRHINIGGSVCGDCFQTFYRFSNPGVMRDLAGRAGFKVISFERFVGEPCYTIFLPVLHLLFIAYHLILQGLSPLFGFHITAVAVFRKSLGESSRGNVTVDLEEQGPVRAFGNLGE